MACDDRVAGTAQGEPDLYAAEHSRLYEPVETAALIPHMLEAFLPSDRGWRSQKTKAGRTRQHETLPPSGGTIPNDEKPS
jgi:hypothetical protein